MNELSVIRRKIYLDRVGDQYKDHVNSIRQIGQALFGKEPPPEIQKVLAAASLLYSPNEQEILDALEFVGSSRYFDRYLADAVYSHSQIVHKVNNIAQCKMDTPCFERFASMLKYRDVSKAKKNDKKLTHPVTLVQCMFYGDPLRSGRGSSGGIGTLLTELGNAMAESVGGISTFVLYDEERASYPFKPIEQVHDFHTIVRLPVRLGSEAPGGFLEDREQIEYAILSALAEYDLQPKIIHVRFLDDASLAAARAAKICEAKLVTTITPDPHRQICDTTGKLRSLPTETALEYINKIMIGDQLLALSDGVLAIGKTTIEKELWPYYPQLEDTRGRVMAGIDEGVRTEIGESSLDIPSLLTSKDLKYRLDDVTQPMILSVGRLAQVKNMAALVSAWADVGYETYNLVLIGGDHRNPSEEERKILDEIENILAKKPHLIGQFCHIPGRSNADIRSIQSFFAREEKSVPNVYVCPSVKEEFGLSILEAMAAGMIAFAPLRGGAGNYIKHGINGFLIDTENSHTIATELQTLLFDQGIKPQSAVAISKNAKRTVETRYSMERIALEFSEFYRRVIDG
jgi:glycosyltransferase involved in cell wall biosynthesis